MSLLIDRISPFWSRVNGSLFPALEEADVEMTSKLYKFVALLEFLQIELFVPLPSSYQVGAKPHDRRCLARAFVAKAFYNAPDTKSFRDRLLHDADLRKVIGWACRGDVPSESTFSRAFAWFADLGLTNGVLEAQIKVWLGDTIIRDVSTDATAIEAREKPLTRAKPKTDTALVETSSLESDVCAAETVPMPLTDSVREPPADASLIDTVISDVAPVTIAPWGATKPEKTTTSKKSAKKAAKHKALAKLYTPTEMTRLERQLDQVPEMALFALSTACDVGCKTNSTGNKDYWIGYKCHVRVAEGNLPLFAVTTSASVHDSQVTIPMMKITDRSITSLYELEDRGYDAFYILSLLPFFVPFLLTFSAVNYCRP